MADVFSAIKKNDLAAVQKYIEDGGEIDAKNNKQETLLIFAITHKHDNIALYLIRPGADIYIENKRNQSPLQLCRQYRLANVSNLLLNIIYKGRIVKEFIKTRDYNLITGIIPDHVDEDGVEEVIADLYIESPRRFIEDINDLKLDYDIKRLDRFLNKTCSNLTTLRDPNVKVYIENYKGKTYRFCFTAKEFEEFKETGYNPFTGRYVDYDTLNPKKLHLDKKECNQMVTVSPEANMLIGIWQTDVFTMGNIYFKVPYSIRRELAPTRPCKPIKLYRGMSFIDENKYIKFLKKSNCDYTACNVRFDTFSSWTPVKSIAKIFTSYYKYGIILSSTFDPDDILVVINNVEYNYSDEKELIVMPGLYRCSIDYDEHFEDYRIVESDYQDDNDDEKNDYDDSDYNDNEENESD